MSTDRRRSPRIEILGRLHGHSVSLDVPITVRELSLGGMAIETTLPLAEGAQHQFLLTLGDDSTVELDGRVMHCRAVAEQGEPPRYVSGIQFIDDEPPDEAGTVGDLIDRFK